MAQHPAAVRHRRVHGPVTTYGGSISGAAGVVIGRGRGVFGTGNGLTVLRAMGGTSVPKAAARSKEEMDAEWERILEDDDDDGDEDDDEDERSDEELLLGFDVKGGEFDDDAEGGMDGIVDEGDGGGGGEELRLEARMPYKQRMKLQKEKQDAWAEKRKTFSPAHNAHIDMVARNRAIAAAR